MFWKIVHFVANLCQQHVKFSRCSDRQWWQDCCQEGSYKERERCSNLRRHRREKMWAWLTCLIDWFIHYNAFLALKAMYHWIEIRYRDTISYSCDWFQDIFYWLRTCPHRQFPTLDESADRHFQMISTHAWLYIKMHWDITKVQVSISYWLSDNKKENKDCSYIWFVLGSANFVTYVMVKIKTFYYI